MNKLDKSFLVPCIMILNFLLLFGICCTKMVGSGSDQVKNSVLDLAKKCAYKTFSRQLILLNKSLDRSLVPNQ